MKKVPKECKSCLRLWTHGIKEGGHNMWCTAYQGAPSYKQIGHCKNDNYSQRKEKDLK